MSFLSAVGLITIISLILLIVYILIISPILTTIEAYNYNKELDKLQQEKMEILYWYDKIYLLTNERLTLEKSFKNKRLIVEIHDQYKKNNDIIKEEISKKIGWVLDSDCPSELSEKYYKAHNEIKLLKSKLGLK